LLLVVVRIVTLMFSSLWQDKGLATQVESFAVIEPFGNRPGYDVCLAVADVHLYAILRTLSIYWTY
jgi:hypothetical protein